MNRLSRYDADEGVVIAYGSYVWEIWSKWRSIAEELSAQVLRTLSCIM